MSFFRERKLTCFNKYFKNVSSTHIKSFTPNTQYSKKTSKKIGNYKLYNKENTSLQSFKMTMYHNKIGKRMSPFISQFKKGSITVETAIAGPLFIFAMANIISLLLIMGTYSSLEISLHKITKQTAMEAYAYDKIAGTIAPGWADLVSALIGPMMGKEKLEQEWGKERLDRLPIAGGHKGLSYDRTKVMGKSIFGTEGEEDIVDMVITYQVKPMVSIVAFSRFSMVNRCRMRAWTGYDNTTSEGNAQGEEAVYITTTGTVYHTNRNCTHLELSVTSISADLVKHKKNENQERYSACGLCKESNQSGTVFITQQGNRYHRNRTCSGLKRGISTIPISQTGSRPICSRCAT